MVCWDEVLIVEDMWEEYGECCFVSFVLIQDWFCVVVWCFCGKVLWVISLCKVNVRERKCYE